MRRFAVQMRFFRNHETRKRHRNKHNRRQDKPGSDCPGVTFGKVPFPNFPWLGTFLNTTVSRVHSQTIRLPFFSRHRGTQTIRDKNMQQSHQTYNLEQCFLLKTHQTNFFGSGEINRLDVL